METAVKTPVRQTDLQELAKSLQQRLRSELAGEIPLHVRCLLQDRTLLVLVQHPQSTTPEAEPIFRVLQQAVQETQPEFCQQARIFLRAVGQKQPAVVHDFTIEKSKSLLDGEDLENDQDDLDDLFKWLGDTSEEKEEDLGKNNSETLNATKTNDTKEFIPPESELNLVESPAVLESDSMADLSLEEPPSQTQSEPEPIIDQEIATEEPLESNKYWGISPKLIVTAAIIAVLGFLASMYAFSRPCVTGSCPQIQTAKRLAQESGETIKKAKTISDVERAKQRLNKATQLLESIPPWSVYYGEAQNLLPNYLTQTNRLDPILTAMEKADQAAEKSQNPPHPMEDWKAIEALWKEAIALLKQVPKTSPVYSLAQQRAKVYRDNLEIITQRIQIEEASQGKIAAAKLAAQAIEARQVGAKSLENWQELESMWEKLTDSLSSLPKTTTADEEAQELLDSYEQKLALVRDRRNQEQISANIYSQSLTLSSLAQAQEEKNQWSEAVSSWRRALTYAQQVPKGTFYYPQAQPLIESYDAALTQAQEKLKVAVVLQKANSDLNRVCAGSPKICDHIVTRQGIRVYLTPTYVNSVRRTAMTAGISGDAGTLAGVDDHLKTLQSALEAISENADLPLEIYDHTRALVGRYSPKPN